MSFWWASLYLSFLHFHDWYLKSLVNRPDSTKTERNASLNDLGAFWLLYKEPEGIADCPRDCRSGQLVWDQLEQHVNSSPTRLGSPSPPESWSLIVWALSALIPQWPTNCHRFSQFSRVFWQILKISPFSSTVFLLNNKFSSILLSRVVWQILKITHFQTIFLHLTTNFHQFPSAVYFDKFWKFTHLTTNFHWFFSVVVWRILKFYPFYFKCPIGQHADSKGNTSGIASEHFLVLSTIYFLPISTFVCNSHALLH